MTTRRSGSTSRRPVTVRGSSDGRPPRTRNSSGGARAETYRRMLSSSPRRSQTRDSLALGRSMAPTRQIANVTTELPSQQTTRVAQVQSDPSLQAALEEERRLVEARAEFGPQAQVEIADTSAAGTLVVTSAPHPVNCTCMMCTSRRNQKLEDLVYETQVQPWYKQTKRFSTAEQIVYALAFLFLGMLLTLFIVPVTPGFANLGHGLYHSFSSVSQGGGDTTTEAPAAPSLLPNVPGLIAGDEAVNVVQRYIELGNDYNEREAEKLATDEFRPDVEPQIFIAEGLDSKIHIQEIGTTNPCEGDTCMVIVVARMTGQQITTADQERQVLRYTVKKVGDKALVHDLR